MGGIIQQRRQWTAIETAVAFATIPLGVVIFVLLRNDVVDRAWPGRVLSAVLIVVFVFAVRSAIREIKRPPDYRV